MACGLRAKTQKTNSHGAPSLDKLATLIAPRQRTDATMTDPTKRRRITPTLVQASPTAAADADGLNARKQQLAVPPVVRPADPNAASLSGPGRRIYVDLFAGNEVNWREVRTGRRAVGARVQRQKARKCLAVALPRAKNCFAPPTTVLNCRRPS